MLRDAEFRVGMKSKAIIIAALAYFILPLDLHSRLYTWRRLL